MSIRYGEVFYDWSQRLRDSVFPPTARRDAADPADTGADYGWAGATVSMADYEAARLRVREREQGVGVEPCHDYGVHWAP